MCYINTNANVLFKLLVPTFFIQYTCFFIQYIKKINYFALIIHQMNKIF